MWKSPKTRRPYNDNSPCNYVGFLPVGRWILLIAFAAISVSTFSCGGGCHNVLVWPIAAHFKNGQPATSTPSCAGLTLRVVGDDNVLYAVSLNAGIWRSSADRTGAYPWEQLSNSPPRAYTIAIDPADSKHLAVGERDGDFQDPNQNASGIWESTDAGDTWTRIYDPKPACSSQAIRSIIFTSKSVLVAATACGLVVKSPGQTFVQVNTPFGTRPITAVASSQTKVWARDASYNLIVSDADAKVWTAVPPPPSNSPGAPGDVSSLAAFDNLAFMCALGPNTSDNQNNFSRLLIFDLGRNQWIQDDNIAGTRNGTGLGGRRFVKAYMVGNGGEIGKDLRLYYGTGQEVVAATGRSDDGTFNWTVIAVTGASGATVADPNYQNQMHSDLWDFDLAPSGNYAWVACDGGVFETRMNGQGWLTRNDRLYTHHAHTIFAPYNASSLSYSTQDNDGWFLYTKQVTSWGNTSLGDVNWTVGDSGHPTLVVFARRSGAGGAVVSGLGSNLPNWSSSLRQVTLNNDQTFGGPGMQGPLFFRFIQSLKDDSNFPVPADAVMLCKLPLQYLDANNQLQTALSNGEPIALVRNIFWPYVPDINASKGIGWQIVGSNLPAGTQGFWVSGGHQHPVYYVYAVNNGTADLYVGEGDTPSKWHRLEVNGPGQPSNLLYRGRNGPAFVNPYDPKTIYVLTLQGVKVSGDVQTNGQAQFSDEQDLTKLITGGGKYPLTDTFSGGNSANVDKASQSGGTTMATLEDMSFDINNPRRIAAASPFSGLFYNNGDGNWHDLTGYLPSPKTPISGVGIRKDDIALALEGRSVLVITGIDYAR